MEIPLASLAVGLLNTVAKNMSDSRSKSLIEYSNPALVRAVTMIESRLVNHEDMDSINQMILSGFTSIYMSAISIASSSQEVRILRTLSKLNPDQDTARNAPPTISLESDQTTPAIDQRNPLNNNYRADLGKPLSSGGVKEIDSLSKNANLAIGRTVEAKFGDNVVNISVGLAPVIVNSETVVNYLSGAGEDISYLGRLNKFKSGMASLSEWVFCTDLLSMHRKTLAHDASGLYKDNLRRNRSKLSNFLTGRVSVAKASNIIVITRETANELGRVLRGDLDDFRTREKFFKDSLGMMLVIVDERRDRLVMMMRSRNETHDYSLREIKNKGGSDSAMSDMLKTMVTAKPSMPSFG